MEKLEVVAPETGAPLGSLHGRREILSAGLWCRTTNVFVLNSHGEILCHQRSLQKERMPGIWCTHFGGHVGVGETYVQNAHKELAEEIGVVVPIERLIPWRITKIMRARVWVKEFVIVIDKPIEELIVQREEIVQAQWFGPRAILEAEHRCPDQWCAGTHDFPTEYYCLRAALAATHEHLREWHPLEHQDC